MRHRHSDKLRFIGQWLRNPRQTAAVVPSSRELAAAMLAELPQASRRIIELGGGTGAITRALVTGGFAEHDLLVLELNEELHAHLRKRFPRAMVVLGEGPADAVVSGLGLLAMDRGAVRGIVQGAFDCLRPGGRFIQFTYGPASPVPEALVGDLGLRMRRGDFVLRNVPPATVYVYERDAG